MSKTLTPLKATRSTKREFTQIEPLSLASLGNFSEEADLSFEKLPTLTRSVKRNKQVMMPDSHDDILPDTEKSFQFELDLGAPIQCQSILREEKGHDKERTPAPQRRLSWADQQSPAKLESGVFQYEAAVYDESDHDSDEDYDKNKNKKKKAAPKRKYGRKKKKEEVILAVKDDSDEDALVMDNSDDEEKDLFIDEGDAEVEEVKKKRKTAQDKRREDEEKLAEKLELLKKLDATDKEIKTEEDVDAEFELLMEIMNKDKKIKVVQPKSKEQIEKELAQFQLDPAVLEKNAFAKWTTTWKDEGKNKKAEKMEVVLIDDMDNFVEEKTTKKKRKEVEETFEDMPDVDRVINDYNSEMAIAMDMDEKRRLEESDGEEKEKKKRTYSKGGTKKVKKGEEVEKTEEEVMAEIGRKKAEASEKATRMKEMKREDKERKKEERAKKKEMEERMREEKRREKKEEREIEVKKKEEEKSLINRIPRTRAEAARRTKALLKLGKRVKEESSDDEDEDDGPRRKRKQRKRSKAVAFVRRIIKKDEDEDNDEVGCGMYIDNPCDTTQRDVCDIDSDEEESDEDGDEYLSVPFLWTSDKENQMMVDGALGPINHDPDENMKRHLNDVMEFSDAITDEYRAIIEKLDGMKLNLFADTTLRRFETRVVHNIDFSSTVSSWPLDVLPNPGMKTPHFDHQIWKRDFKGLVRIHPDHSRRDQFASVEIDKLTGVADTVTRKDVVENLRELVMSKMKKKTWTPLPSSRNPFDVPEISTRKEPTELRGREKDYNPVSYVHKTAVVHLPIDSVNKKRKKTRKEVYLEIANTPKPILAEPEDIYKDVEEGGEGGDEYQFEWNEQGDIIDNPMRDNLIGDDPFGANPYDGMDFVVQEEVVMAVDDESAMMDTSSQFTQDSDDEEETQLGEAFSFMANHIDT